jgi:endonuclease YncB( thermonuclease family)
MKRISMLGASLTVAALLAGGATAGDKAATVDPDAPSLVAGPPPPATATVVAVYDGDTFTLSTGDRVRLRWVNTPELRPPEDYAIEARELTATIVLQKSVKLLYGATQRDGYGRLLAGAMVGDVNLSISLLEAGLGHLFVIPPDDTDLAPFIAAQEKARAARRGIWSSARYQGALHITSFHANADGDDRQNVNGEYLRICNVSPETLDLTGYRIADISGKSWTFPTVMVPSGHTFKVHSGRGDNQVDPRSQLALYLGSADPIWNNTEDRATIYDRYGRVVDSRDHHVDNPNP